MRAEGIMQAEEMRAVDRGPQVKKKNQVPEKQPDSRFSESHRLAGPRSMSRWDRFCDYGLPPPAVKRICTSWEIRMDVSGSNSQSEDPVRRELPGHMVPKGHLAGRTNTLDHLPVPWPSCFIRGRP